MLGFGLTLGLTQAGGGGGVPYAEGSDTPTSDFDIIMSQRATLPDGAYPQNAGKGYPCTGLTYDEALDCYWGGHGTASASSNTGLVKLGISRSTLTVTLLDQFRVGDIGLASGSVQGVTVDSSDDTLWFVLKETGGDPAHLVHVEKDWTLIGDTELASGTWNAIAYDPSRDLLIMMQDNGVVNWMNKPATPGGAISTAGKSFTAAGSNNDQLFYDRFKDEVLVTGGSNGVSGTIDFYDCTPSTPTLISTATADEALAIEGVVRFRDDIIITSDQWTHDSTTNNTNQIQIYRNCMVGTPVFSMSNVSAAEGEDAVFTLNVTRNGVAGEFSGTWAVSAGSSPAADTTDFGGSFPSGSWTIASGDTSTTITVTPNEDTDIESNDKYTLTITYDGGTVATATGTITDDDAPPSGYEPETDALLARMTSAPDSTREGHIDDFIAALKTAGVWDKLDGLFVTAAHDEQAALLDWKEDRTAVKAASAPTFTTDTGFATTSTQFWHLDITPADCVYFTQNSASMLYWANDSTATGTNGTATFASLDSGNIVGLNPRSSGDLIASRLCSGTATTGGTITDKAGLAGVSRTSSTAVQHYKNGAASGSAGSATSASLASVAEFSIGRRGGSTYQATNCALAAIGGGLTAQEMSDFYDAALAYMTAVGNV